MRTIGIIFAIICVCAAIPAPESPPVLLNKPGICPPKQSSVGTCIFDPSKNCENDGVCPDSQKCCSDGCSSVCMNVLAVQPIRPPGPTQPSVSIEKSGRCPPTQSSVGTCIFDPSKNCENDGACPGQEKCCNDGCASVCTRPILQPPPTGPNPALGQKIGNCPINDVTGICLQPGPGVGGCSSDSTCPGSQKCCERGCTTTCLDPVPIASG